MKLSIITVCFNSASVIERCLESVLREYQSGVELEQIVIDGGSTDGTVEIIRRYTEQMPIRWVSEPDKGIYDAMNKGVFIATGEVVAILNSDDWYIEGALKRVAEEWEKRDVDYLYGSVERWENGESVGVTRPLARELWEKEIWWQMPLPHVGLFVKKRLFTTKVGWFDLSYRIGGDHDWVVRLFKTGAKGEELQGDPVARVEMGGVGGGWARFAELKRCALRHGQPKYRVNRKILRYRLIYLLQKILPKRFFLSLQSWKRTRY